MNEVQKNKPLPLSFFKSKRNTVGVLLAAVLVISLVVSIFGSPKEEAYSSYPQQELNLTVSSEPEMIVSESDISAPLDEPESTLPIPSRPVGSGTDEDGFVDGWY